LKDLRILIDLLTGHNALNHQLTLLGKKSSPFCSLWEEELDTRLHFLPVPGKMCCHYG